MYWCYIYHRDEPDKKDHYHLFIEPNKRLKEKDMQMLKLAFEEPDPENEKPLSCMPFRKSDFENWYLYGKHDQVYLASKHLVKYTYDYPDSAFCVSDPSLFNDYISLIDPEKYMSAIDKMQLCHDKLDMNMYEAMSYLRIPYSGMYGFMKVWETFYKERKQ